MTIPTTGRFGHADDPAIDFAVEVRTLAGKHADRRRGVAHHRDLEERVKKALDFPAATMTGCEEAMDSLKLVDAALAADAEGRAA